MLWKQAAQGDERAFMTVKNVEASSLTTGYLAALAVGTGASFDGTQAVRCVSGATGNGTSTFLGVAFKDIASNAYGLIQTYGPCGSVAFSNFGTSVTVNVGDALTPSAVAGLATSTVAPSYAASGFKYIVASNTSATVSGVGYVSGWIRGVL